MHPIIIFPRGRLGNLMFQYMLADQLQRRLGNDAEIFGPGISEWEIAPRPLKFHPKNPILMKGHVFNLDEIADRIRSGLFDSTIIAGWGMRVEYYADLQSARHMFISNTAPTLIGDDEILINVRSEDIESGKHPGYYPLPFDFYRALLDTEAKHPVFMGQLDPSPYTDALRKTFPHARYLPSNSRLHDFQTIRHAKHIALSISSFAWLAAWMSDTAEHIHYPVAGIFDPRRKRQNLMPVDDRRYIFWETEFPQLNTRTERMCAAHWASANRRVARTDSNVWNSIKI